MEPANAIFPSLVFALPIVACSLLISKDPHATKTPPRLLISWKYDVAVRVFPPEPIPERAAMGGRWGQSQCSPPPPPLAHGKQCAGSDRSRLGAAGTIEPVPKLDDDRELS